MTAKQRNDIAQCSGGALLLRCASVLFWIVGLAIAIAPYILMLIGLYVIQTGVQLWKYATVLAEAGQGSFEKDSEPEPEPKPENPTNRPDSYKLISCCCNCLHSFTYQEYDCGAIYYCTFNAPTRPPCGSVAMGDEWPDTDAQEAWYEWSALREVRPNGKCQNYLIDKAALPGRS